MAGGEVKSWIRRRRMVRRRRWVNWHVCHHGNNTSTRGKGNVLKRMKQIGLGEQQELESTN